MDKFPIDPIQALIDGMNAAHQAERSTSQMTLGTLIQKLLELDPALSIDVSDQLNSYRGYYSDLAIEPGESTVGELLTECRNAMGRVFMGYKGGDFLMGENTPIWVAPYGDCGPRLMSLGSTETGIVAITEEEEW